MENCIEYCEKSRIGNTEYIHEVEKEALDNGETINTITNTGIIEDRFFSEHIYKYPGRVEKGCKVVRRGEKISENLGGLKKGASYDAYIDENGEITAQTVCVFKEHETLVYTKGDNKCLLTRTRNGEVDKLVYDENGAYLGNLVSQHSSFIDGEVVIDGEVCYFYRSLLKDNMLTNFPNSLDEIYEEAVKDIAVSNGIDLPELAHDAEETGLATDVPNVAEQMPEFIVGEQNLYDNLKDAEEIESKYDEI